MLADTLKKFGYPQSLVREYKHWLVLLRPQQVTLGSVILICREDVTAFSQISPAAWNECPQVIKNLEFALKAAFDYDKINHLMLMMVDPEVHWHVIPRYSADRHKFLHTFKDHSWPKPPDLSRFNEIDDPLRDNIRDHLRKHFPPD